MDDIAAQAGQAASGKKLLFIWQPPKPISEMTEEELDTAAQEIADRVREKVEPSSTGT